MIEIIKNFPAFTSLSEQWNKLAASFNNPLLCHEWFSSCLHAFYNEENIHVFVLRNGEEISAIAPLVLVKRHGTKWLEFIGNSHLYEPCCLLYKDNESLQKLFRTLIGSSLPFALTRVQADLPFQSVLTRYAKFKGLIFNKSTASSFLIHCNSSWEEYYGLVPARRRYDHRRAEKRAAQYGKIAFECITPTPEDCRQYFEKAIQVEAAGWKGRKGSALLINNKLRSFFLDYAEKACRNGTLRILFLHIGGHPAAMQICIAYGDKLWVLKIGYNEKWAKCSPGILMTKYSIIYAFEHNFKAYEFLGSDESWVQPWATGKHNYKSIIFYPFSGHGLLGLGIDTTRLAPKKIKVQFERFKEAVCLK